MAGKTGGHAYVSTDSGVVREETDVMEVEVSSAKDARQQTMPHTPIKTLSLRSNGSSPLTRTLWKFNNNLLKCESFCKSVLLMINDVKTMI